MRYTDSHEWIECKGKVGTVGITDYAQKELGDIVSVELPKVGQILKAKQEACVLESTKAAADVYTPVSGKVIAVNEALKKDASLINRDAQKAGWLFQIELSNPQEVDRLMTEKEYTEMT
ncbi:MAG: glycine cleavage system protein GcvH [Verrucomicrobia bacterium]|nr:glycine cleavage system protein GcvH [Verrucomicrobiota bacterium]MBU6446847.1 glycine cleavage system protein GcvH [Verrucomicrobiota bacterium]MDE3048265.1 glycine cleavage system protein GcvH [Verrucomicrobiota bacterium]